MQHQSASVARLSTIAQLMLHIKCWVATCWWDAPQTLTQERAAYSTPPSHGAVDDAALIVSCGYSQVGRISDLRHRCWPCTFAACGWRRRLRNAA